MTKIDRITLHITDITPKTKWSFIAVETDDGACGWGEASLQGEEDAILAAATSWQARLFENADPTPRLLGAPTDLAEAAVVSALDHALWDLAARRGGQSLAALLGGAAGRLRPKCRRCCGVGLHRLQDRAELGIGEQGFAPFLAAGIYDAMMPDVKYVGGLQTVMRLAEMFAAAGVGFSPHNPSGPICHAVSLHIAPPFPAASGWQSSSTRARSLKPSPPAPCRPCGAAPRLCPPPDWGWSSPWMKKFSRSMRGYAEAVRLN